MFIYSKQREIQTVFEISSRFWVHENWSPNFDELTKKGMKPQFDKTVPIHLSVISEKNI